MHWFRPEDDVPYFPLAPRAARPRNVVQGGVLGGLPIAALHPPLAPCRPRLDLHPPTPREYAMRSRQREVGSPPGRPRPGRLSARFAPLLRHRVPRKVPAVLQYTHLDVARGAACQMAAATRTDDGGGGMRRGASFPARPVSRRRRVLPVGQRKPTAFSPSASAVYQIVHLGPRRGTRVPDAFVLGRERGSRNATARPSCCCRPRLSDPPPFSALPRFKSARGPVRVAEGGLDRG